MTAEQQFLIPDQSITIWYDAKIEDSISALSCDTRYRFGHHKFINIHLYARSLR